MSSKQEENNRKYAEAYEEGRNGDIIQDAMRTFARGDEIEQAGFKAGKEDRYKYGRLDDDKEFSSSPSDNNPEIEPNDSPEESSYEPYESSDSSYYSDYSSNSKSYSSTSSKEGSFSGGLVIVGLAALTIWGISSLYNYVCNSSKLSTLPENRIEIFQNATPKEKIGINPPDIKGALDYWDNHFREEGLLENKTHRPYQMPVESEQRPEISKDRRNTNRITRSFHRHHQALLERNLNPPIQYPREYPEMQRPPRLSRKNATNSRGMPIFKKILPKNLTPPIQYQTENEKFQDYQDYNTKQDQPLSK